MTALGIKALVFDTFGTVVDWRTSVAADMTSFFGPKGVDRDWIAFADAWRGGYYPAMERALARLTAKVVGAAVFVLAGLLAASPVRADDPVALTVSRDTQRDLWRRRIQEFLAKGMLPIIDLESSLPPRIGDAELANAVIAMDRLGIGVVAFDGIQAPQDGSTGYRWSRRVHRAVNAYPSRFALATNGGNNPNWSKQASGERSYIAQLETAAQSGHYVIFGEVEFLHYRSPRQCQQGQFGREVSVPFESPNGKRLLKLAEETGMLLPIHLEAEDGAYDSLEKTLAAYPKAKIMVAHFGQIRFPNRARHITPERIRAMLTKFPNLYFDIAVGAPGHTYPCNDNIVDVVVWEANHPEGLLKPEYKALLTDFSGRFFVGLDFGDRRQTMATFFEQSSKNIRRILRDLPEAARHAIAYRNAWMVLTGTPWD